MYIQLDSTPLSARLEEPEDFKRFHVAVPDGMTDEQVGEALRGFGELREGHAWINPAALRRAAAGRVPRSWEEAFAAMLAFAQSKGWMDERGHLRAHRVTAAGSAS